jgi:hypothetical protein
MGTLRILWRLARGYRFHPWDSPYLKWRIETYWGIPAAQIGFREFTDFCWTRRSELFRFLRWAARMDATHSR